MATTSWLDKNSRPRLARPVYRVVGVPFILDDVHRLTYFSSLAFWLVPTLLLLPRFLEYTDSGGRRRWAMLLTTISVVAMGVLLDVVLGHVILQFDESATANYIAWLTVPVLQARTPIEEFLFYAMAPIATLLIYGWASEYWIVHYTPSHDQAHLPEHGRIVAVSIRALVGAVILMAIGLAVFARNPVRAGAVRRTSPFSSGWRSCLRYCCSRRCASYVNWRAFGVTALYLLVTSIGWEATLAVPRHWWGYKPSAMLGIWVSAWTRDPAWPFPLEAALVWFASPFSIVLMYEFVKLKKYLADPSKPTLRHRRCAEPAIPVHGR